MSSLSADRHNHIRKLILDVLAPEYPKTVDAIILRRCLSNFGYAMQQDSLDSYLAYLEECGFVRVSEKKEFGIKMAAITARGLDVLDGRVNHVGVGVEC